jgi:hypothetical protein
MADHDRGSGDVEDRDRGDGQQDGTVAEPADDEGGQWWSGDPGHRHDRSGVDDVGWSGTGVAEVGEQQRAAHAGRAADDHERDGGDWQRGR